MVQVGKNQQAHGNGECDLLHNNRVGSLFTDSLGRCSTWSGDGYARESTHAEPMTDAVE
jgi:hypothetical protein